MSLFNVQDEFKTGMLSKKDYIDEMYKIHSNLFDYAELLNHSDIERIEITQGSVVMTFRSSGIQLLCPKGDKRIAAIDALNFSSYEQSELSMQLKLMANETNIFDIGANYGWYSLSVAHQLPHVKIFAFEPIPNTFNFLNRNILLNGITNVQTFNFGFSEKPGEFEFYYDPNLSVNASLVNVGQSDTIETVTCKIEKLDDFVLKNNFKIDFIKCDVEGAELMVFQGGEEVIARDKPVIFTEMLRKWTAQFNYSPNDIIRFFERQRYKCFVIDDDYLSELRIVDESTKETNYIFLHEEKHKKKIRQLKR